VRPGFNPALNEIVPGSERDEKTVELCCVLDFAGNQHYPPSWVEASNSLDQVVTGSATPVSASQ